MNTPTYAIIAAVAGLLVGYYGSTLFSTPYRRRRTWGRIRCLMGDHDLGPVIKSSSGRMFQYCERCNRPCTEFKRTGSDDTGDRGKIRRIR